MAAPFLYNPVINDLIFIEDNNTHLFKLEKSLAPNKQYKWVIEASLFPRVLTSGPMKTA